MLYLVHVMITTLIHWSMYWCAVSYACDDNKADTCIVVLYLMHVMIITHISMKYIVINELQYRYHTQSVK